MPLGCCRCGKRDPGVQGLWAQCRHRKYVALIASSRPTTTTADSITGPTLKIRLDDLMLAGMTLLNAVS
jgi:hypothetical protein